MEQKFKYIREIHNMSENFTAQKSVKIAIQFNSERAFSFHLYQCIIIKLKIFKLTSTLKIFDKDSQYAKQTKKTTIKVNLNTHFLNYRLSKKY